LADVIRVATGNPDHLLASIAAERERRELERVARDAIEIRARCRSLHEFVKAAWKYIDPAEFVDNWHVEAICQHLEDVTFGRCRRLIINIPPRHMKSLLVSVAWPAWTWSLIQSSPLSGPGVGFLSTSYAHSLSVRDNVKCRRLIDSPWYRALWGDRFALTSDQNTKIRFENNRGGYRIASSVDGTATGEGGSVVMFDDPLSAKEANSVTARVAVNDWWDNTMSTRLNDPKTGAYVGVMQRLHEDDLVGHILAKGEPWTVLCLPARYEEDHPHVYAGDPRKVRGELLWQERVGETELRSLEASLGSYGTAGQLQQRPAPAGGGIFKATWWRYYRPEALPKARRIIQSWDTGFKAKTDNDPSVCLTWAECDDGYYLIEVWRDRIEFPELKRQVVSQAAKHNPHAILVEDKASGQSLIQEMQRDTRLPIVPIGVDTDKIARAHAVTPLIESGRVFLPEGAAWLADFTGETSQFPASAHDDQVDSMTQALAYMSREQVTSAGFLTLIRDQTAAKTAAEATEADRVRQRATIQCPHAPGSVEYERFMADAGA
jgi:predicted phage terminase large subunit-like protein